MFFSKGNVGGLRKYDATNLPLCRNHPQHYNDINILNKMQRVGT